VNAADNIHKMLNRINKVVQNNFPFLSLTGDNISIISRHCNHVILKIIKQTSRQIQVALIKIKSFEDIAQTMQACY